MNLQYEFTYRESKVSVDIVSRYSDAFVSAFSVLKQCPSVLCEGQCNLGPSALCWGPKKSRPISLVRGLKRSRLICFVRGPKLSLPICFVRGSYEYYEVWQCQGAEVVWPICSCAGVTEIYADRALLGGQDPKRDNKAKGAVPGVNSSVPDSKLVPWQTEEVQVPRLSEES